MRRSNNRFASIGFFIVLLGLVAIQANCVTPIATKPNVIHPAPVPSVPTQRVVLEIEIVGVRSDQGTVRVTVFVRAEGFPADHTKAYQTRVVPAKKGVVRLLFKHIGQGDYAIAAIHDENDNLRLDAGFLGIPKEGYAVSNDASSRVGPPRFSEARLSVSDSHKHFVMTMRYP